MPDVSIDRFVVWNDEAFRLLYKCYYKALVSYSMQIVISRDEAEDIVQSVFTVLLERKYQFTTMASLEAFLYNSIRNSSLDKLRHKDVSDQYVSSVEERYEEFNVNDSEAVYSEEVYRRLFYWIDQLPPKSREVFLLYIKGLTNQEIAAQLNISFETVKTHKKRSMAFLRKHLGHEELMLLFILTFPSGI